MDLQSFGQLMEAGEFETPQDKTLVTISAAELQKKNIPPIRFIVDGLLPAGLNILASPPKYGKAGWSWVFACQYPLGPGSWATRPILADVCTWP